MKRYEKRWANGAWRIFDTIRYTTVHLCYTEADADACLPIANKEQK